MLDLIFLFDYASPLGYLQKYKLNKNMLQFGVALEI